MTTTRTTTLLNEAEAIVLLSTFSGSNDAVGARTAGLITDIEQGAPLTKGLAIDLAGYAAEITRLSSRSALMRAIIQNCDFHPRDGS